MKIKQGRLLVPDVKDRIGAHRALSILDVGHVELNRELREGMPWLERLPVVWFLVIKWALAGWRPEYHRPDPSDPAWGSNLLTPERMLFPSVSEFESIDALAKIHQMPFSQVVHDIVADNGGLGRRKLLLEEHVMARQAPLDVPAVIQGASNRLRH